MFPKKKNKIALSKGLAVSIFPEHRSLLQSALQCGLRKVDIQMELWGEDGCPVPGGAQARLAGALGSLVWWDTQSMAGLSNGMVFKVPSNLSHPTRKPRRAPETTTERTLSLPGVWHVAVVCRHTQQWAQCFCSLLWLCFSSQDGSCSYRNALLGRP